MTIYPILDLYYIIMVKDYIFVIYKPLVTTQFYTKFVSYEVETGDYDQDVCKASELLDFIIYHMVKSKCSLYFIPLKYDLTDIIQEHFK